MGIASRALSSPVIRATRSFTPKIASSSKFSSRRNVHTATGMKYPIENGLGDFLSPNALRVIAGDYQNGLLTRLNELVKDTDLQSLSVVTTVLNTASDSSRILIFNMASQALNNSFFLDNLKPPTSSKSNHEDEIHRDLLGPIKAEFGSLGQLKSNVSAAAMGMIASGWIWLVMDQNLRLAVIPTYGAGTILARARRQRMARAGNVIGENMKTTSSTFSPFSNSAEPPSPSASSPSPSPSHPFTSRAQKRTIMSSALLSNISADTRTTAEDSKGQLERSSVPLESANIFHYGGTLSPLFCISVHEHAWMTDYGVWGKEEYLTRFWDVLDWRNVSATHAHFSK